jgi:hypothetical protein
MVDGLSPSPVIVGTGRFVTENRPVQSFSRISVTSGIHATVTRGGGESVEVSAEDNILPLIEVTVTGGTLQLGFTPHVGSITSHGVELHIGARELRAVQASAGSRIDVGAIDAADFAITLAAGAEFIGSGSVARLDLDYSSGSHAQLPGLAAGAVTANLSGGSTALLRVVDSLIVTASGGSVFEYSGDPVVQANTSGGSTVRRVGP